MQIQYNVMQNVIFSIIILIFILVLDFIQFYYSPVRVLFFTLKAHKNLPLQISDALQSVFTETLGSVGCSAPPLELKHISYTD